MKKYFMEGMVVFVILLMGGIVFFLMDVFLGLIFSRIIVFIISLPLVLVIFGWLSTRWIIKHG